MVAQRILRQRARLLAAFYARGHIDAEVPLPPLAVLDIDRRSPNRPNLSPEAGTIGTGVKCQDTDCRREHRRSGIGEVDGLHVAIN